MNIFQIDRGVGKENLERFLNLSKYDDVTFEDVTSSYGVPFVAVEADGTPLALLAPDSEELKELKKTLDNKNIEWCYIV